MTYAPLDTKFPEHPKVIGLSDAAFRLYVEALCHAKKYQTDGLVGSAALPRLHRRGVKLAGELVGVGLWHAVEGGYEINGFLERNLSRDQVDALREERREAGRKGGKAKAERQALAKQTSSNLLSKTVAKKEVEERREEPTETKVGSSGVEPLGSTLAKVDPIWDAFVAECGPAPETKSGRGAWNHAAKEIRGTSLIGADALPANQYSSVRTAFAAYRRKWPNVEASPPAVAKHWTSLTAVRPVERPAPFVDDAPPRSPALGDRVRELLAQASKALEMPA